MKKFSILTLMIFLLVSCLDAGQQLRQTSSANNNISGDPDDFSGDGVAGGDGGIEGDGNTVIAKVELRHLIQPKIDNDDEGGDYKRKLTFPKNYNGYMYLAGINIASLSSNSIKARFRFGLDRAEIEVAATVSTAPGLTPQTDVEVLILDLRSRPFEDVQLIYDLYDYNNYSFDGSDDSALSEPVSHNRNDKLFCRGLKLEDDPTFTGSVSDLCSGAGDICKYSYAKVIDKGLVEAGAPNIPTIPSEVNIQSGDVSYYDDLDSLKVARCLPNDPYDDGLIYTLDLSTSLTFNDISSTQIDGIDYYYQGPYRALNTDSWQITSDAIEGEYGIFGGQIGGDIQFGYNSKVFPIYTQFDLSKDKQYLGSAQADDAKSLLVMASNNLSQYMDGCNERISTVDDITGEHIGSCNVTATIEIVSIDDNGNETIVDITDEVKLQLVKPAAINSNGDNVLLSSFQQCSSTSQCGSDSCCINSRCWSKNVVSQCIEDLPSYGNLITGEACSTDYQCASLCCDKTRGTCQPHDTIADTPVYCSKPSGQSCVAKEWCQQHPVTTCGIVRTGTDPFGNVTCALRCITAQIYGDCTAADGAGAGRCVPPGQPDSPVFNPTDPNRCNPEGGLLTIEQLIEIANNPDQGNPQL